MPFVTLLQVGNRQKDTLSKLQAFQQKLRNSTQKQQQQQDKAAAATKAAQEAAAVQQQEAAEAAAAAASKQEAANGSGDKAAGGADEAYDGKVGCGCHLSPVTGKYSTFCAQPVCVRRAVHAVSCQAKALCMFMRSTHVWASSHGTKALTCTAACKGSIHA